jgi:hypothetical protein
MQAVRNPTEEQISKWIASYVGYNSLKTSPEIVQHLWDHFNAIRNETGKSQESARKLFDLQRIALRFGMLDWYRFFKEGREQGILSEEAEQPYDLDAATLIDAEVPERDTQTTLRDSAFTSYLVVHKHIEEVFPQPKDALLFLSNITNEADFKSKVDGHCADKTQADSLLTAWKVAAIAEPPWWDDRTPYSLFKMRLCFAPDDELKPPEATIGGHSQDSVWS